MCDKYYMIPKLREDFFNKVRLYNDDELRSFQHQQPGYTHTTARNVPIGKYRIIWLYDYFFCAVCGHMIESDDVLYTAKYQKHSEQCMEAYILKRGTITTFDKTKNAYEAALAIERELGY